MELTCINCPVGCRMNAVLENGVVTEVTGNACKRGADYARQECVAPMRMLTAVIPVEGSKLVTTPKFRAVCTPISVTRPAVRTVENRSGARRAIQ